MSSVARDEPHARSGEVELVLAVDARKLRRLASDERAARLAAHFGGTLDELRDSLEVDPVRRDVVEEEQRVGAATSTTSLMQCAARSAPHARSAPRSRARISFVPTESVDAARNRSSSSG